MSRMAGIIYNQDTGFGLAGQMLAHVGRAPGYTLREVRKRRAAMAWTGRGCGLAESGSCLAVIDGCLCNRSELPEAADDAGRVLRLYERYGFEGALVRLCGDFSIALFDAKEDTLWLARDRAGIRPCYYAWCEEGVAFASHPFSLLTLAGVSTEVNPVFAVLYAASHYRTIDNDPSASPYRDIRQLPAAHLARVHGGRVQLSRWWQLPDVPDFTEDETVLAGRYRELLFQVVSERLQCVSKPAFTLSGGMDSSTVLATAVRLTGHKQNAFSTVYDDPTYDERHEIAGMLEETVDRWHPVTIGHFDLFETVSRMVAAHGEPVATATWLSHWMLCQKVSEAGFDALFGGLGGDELNAGEYEYFFFHFADLRAGGHEAQLTSEIEAWSRYHDHPIWRKNRSVAEAQLNRLVDFSIPGRCLADRRRIERYRHLLRPGCLDLSAFEPVMEAPFGSYLKNRTWQDISREAAPCCLRAEDRQTRACGLVNLDPFYDHRLMEFMFRVPGSLKIRNGVTKILLRSAMQGVLPEETRLRVKKTGWNAPAHVWFTGSLADTLRDMVRSSSFLAGEYYDPEMVLHLIDEHGAIVAFQRPVENHMMFLWQLLNLELWLRELRSFASLRKNDGNQATGG